MVFDTFLLQSHEHHLIAGVLREELAVGTGDDHFVTRLQAEDEDRVVGQSHGLPVDVNRTDGDADDAEADLERARRELGVEGADNPQIREAVAGLGEAELALDWTALRAPARGLIVDLDVTSGVFAKAGGRLLTFVSFEETWVEAYLTENNIANINIGDPAELSLDLYPGRIFDGKVASITYAASDGTFDSALPSVPRSTGWMRDPQRFPVRITMTSFETGSENYDIRRMVNGQADVVVYTGESWLMNRLAALWVRLMSFLSYAY